jgi:hypothetical protein
MNRTERTLPRQANPIKSSPDDSVDVEPSPSACADERCRNDRELEESFDPVPYSDRSWYLSMFWHNGVVGDYILWELTEQTDQVEPVRRIGVDGLDTDVAAATEHKTHYQTIADAERPAGGAS